MKTRAPDTTAITARWIGLVEDVLDGQLSAGEARAARERMEQSQRFKDTRFLFLGGKLSDLAASRQIRAAVHEIEAQA